MTFLRRSSGGLRNDMLSMQPLKAFPVLSGLSNCIIFTEPRGTAFPLVTSVQNCFWIRFLSEPAQHKARFCNFYNFGTEPVHWVPLLFIFR